MTVAISCFAGAGWQFFNDNGVVLAGGKIYSYAAGTTTPLTTYTSSSGSIANSNPIILDSAGRPPSEIWLTSTSIYKFVLRDASDNVIRTYDNIPGIATSADITNINAQIAAVYTDFANTTDDAKGDALVGFRQANDSGFLTGSSSRTVSKKLQEVVSVKDFGAIGDNTYRPLSGVTSLNGINTTGWTVSQWQTIYPFVTALTNSLDWCVIQAAMNAVTINAYQRGAVYFPDGYYVIKDSLQIPVFISLFGNTTTGCIINNQNESLTAPQAIAKGGVNMIGLQVKNMTWRGAKTAFLFAAGMQSCIFENVNMDLQTDFNINTTDCEVNKFINCIFSNAQYGMFCAGSGFVNMNDFTNCEFNATTWSCVYFQTSGGSTVNNFYGCRFEGGGVNNRATIDIANGSTNLNLDGCYFENTGSYAISEVGSTNSTTVKNCHFTYDGVSAGYRFASDGIIDFGTNNWYVGSNGPNTMYVSGVNNNQLGNNNILYFAHSLQHKKFVSKYVHTPATLQQDLLKFHRTNTTSAVTNMQALTGVLTINYYNLDSASNPASYSRIYHVFVKTNGSSVLGATLNQISNLSVPNGSTLVVQQKTGATTNDLILEAVFTGITPSTELQSVFEWSFEYIEASTLKTDTIEATIA